MASLGTSRGMGITSGLSRCRSTWRCPKPCEIRRSRLAPTIGWFQRHGHDIVFAAGGNTGNGVATGGTWVDDVWEWDGTAGELGLTVVASASLMQSRLTTGLPEALRDHFPNATTDAQRAIEFTRTLPGVTVALVGMKSVGHVGENLEAARRSRSPA